MATRRHFPTSRPLGKPARSGYHIDSTSVDGDRLVADDGNQHREDRLIDRDASLGNTPGPVWPDHGEVPKL
jgi:hypothetical protein